MGIVLFQSRFPQHINLKHHATSSSKDRYKTKHIISAKRMSSATDKTSSTSDESPRTAETERGGGGGEERRRRKPVFKPTLILHGGAGGISRARLPPELWQQYRSSLRTYLRSTHELLNSGATALDAAVHAVSLMEDDPLFNCGRGSVFTSAGTIEMEASLMVTSVSPDSDWEGSGGYDGDDGDDNDDDDEEGRRGRRTTTGSWGWGIKRGAGVMNIRNVRHPIQLARELLLRPGVDEDGNYVSERDGGNMHAQLSGPYAEGLARDWGLEFRPDEWFWTKRRWEEHRRGLTKAIEGAPVRQGGKDTEPVIMSQGTVGCVCLDKWGNLATATSTGGMTNKKPGRIGDTLTLGAGFWAESWEEEVEVAVGSSGDAEMRYLPQFRSPIELRNPFTQSINWRALHPWNLCQDLFLGDCLRGDSGPATIEHNRSNNADQKKPLLQAANDPTRQYTTLQETQLKAKKTRRAVALSGTGNGDSFLRVSAARTASAMLRFSAPSFSLRPGFSFSSNGTTVGSSNRDLAHAVTAVAGPDGELQQSAGRRWLKTGEGEGGLIGIEAEMPIGDDEYGNESENDHGLRRGRVVFDFNCGGMYRAWIEETSAGDQERVMVFRDEY